MSDDNFICSSESVEFKKGKNKEESFHNEIKDEIINDSLSDYNLDGNSNQSNDEPFSISTSTASSMKDSKGNI